MKKILSFQIIVCWITFNGFAQQWCGTDALHEFNIQNDSAYRNHILTLENQIRSMGHDHHLPLPERNFAYIIPVVVHVIHIGEAVGTGSNISDSQINGAIAGINDRWRNLNGYGSDLELEFCLTSFDPNGNPSTGINRVNGSAVPNYQNSGINHVPNSTCGGANPNAIKDLSRWAVGQFYNIWVVKSICEGYGGYASYPNGNVYDGAVIVSAYFTAADDAPAHELGHGFFLYHTFEGDGGNLYCPNDTDCLLYGDRICDTQPHKQSGCGTSNVCTGNGAWDNSRYNYM